MSSLSIHLRETNTVLFFLISVYVQVYNPHWLYGTFVRYYQWTQRPCEMNPIHPHSELNPPEAPPTAWQLIIGGAHLHSQRGGYIFKFNFFPAL